MSDFLARLQADRAIDVQFWKKHPELRAQLVDDAYPDEAHFVYELLQNAEDAKASVVQFELFDDHLVLTHDGERLFTESDVEAITDVSKTGKGDGRETIGRFGIGFKSVFKYTESPKIYSGEFSFEITDFVLPRAIPPRDEQNVLTTFIFPFNSPKKNPGEAYLEVKAGLEQLSETTLLYLSNLQAIVWKVGSTQGAIHREEHSDAHIEILKKQDGKGEQKSHWLRFNAPVRGIENQRVAIAFNLEFIGDHESYDAQIPLAKQLKIVPATKGKVSVFFPAEKETSGLRYHLHAPFAPELSRASIKNSPENIPLFEQLGWLSGSALTQIKELGLLTGEFLAVLPNNDDELPDRYKVIREAVLGEMKFKELVPTHFGGFAPANRLVQARAAIKSLLSDKDLEFVTGKGYAVTWAIGATQRNSNQDRFLSSLRIPHWDTQNLKELFEEQAIETDTWRGRVDPVVMNWLGSKSDEWHQALYALLNKYCEDEGDFGDLGQTRIVRLSNGKYSVPTKAYFPAAQPTKNDPLPRVSASILISGNKLPQQVAAKRFLEHVGVMVPGEREEVTQLLEARYGVEGDVPSDKTYIEDLQRFIAFSERYPEFRRLFVNPRLFRVESPNIEWCNSAFVYLDSPFLTTGLSAFYSATNVGAQKQWPLSKWYLECGIPVPQIVKFALFAGCVSKFEGLYVKSLCSRNPRWNYLSSAPGERLTSPLDIDYSLTASVEAALHSGNVEFSRLVWTTMCSAPVEILKARYRKNASGGSHYAHSNLVVSLKKAAWVPLKDGTFVTPMDAGRGSLREGFTFDSGYKWLEAVEFGVEMQRKAADTAARAAKRAEFGFASEDDLQRALAFSKLPADEQERLLAVGRSHSAEEIELPEHPVRNIDLRAQRVGEQAKQTPEKSSELRTRAVQTGYEAAKAEAKLYLMEQYTNRNGQMICQVCKDELPFKLPNGQYYFEAVEATESSPKRFRESFLALCPNHAAAFRFSNAQRNSMQELIVTANDREIEIALGGEETTILFTEMHLADIRACLASVESEDAEA